MEALSVVASVMGIITFVGACVEMFAKLRRRLRRAPEILRLIIQDLKIAEPILKTAGHILHHFRNDMFDHDNTTLSICEKYVRKLKMMAEDAENYRKINHAFPDYMIPELEERRQTLGYGVDSLRRNLRIIQRRNTDGMIRSEPLDDPSEIQRPGSAPPMFTEEYSSPPPESYQQPYPQQPLQYACQNTQLYPEYQYWDYSSAPGSQSSSTFQYPIYH